MGQTNLGGGKGNGSLVLRRVLIFEFEKFKPPFPCDYRKKITQWGKCDNQTDHRRDWLSCFFFYDWVFFIFITISISFLFGPTTA